MKKKQNPIIRGGENLRDRIKEISDLPGIDTPSEMSLNTGLKGGAKGL